MARFEVRPVISQTAPNSWSYTLILSDPIHHLDPSQAPVWIIAIVLSGDLASEQGPIFIENLSNTYQKIELKTPEALYQSLKSFTTENQGLDISFAAICFTLTHATIMGIGRFQTQVWRNNRQGTVLAGFDNNWHLVEGKWFETDRWCLLAGENNQIDFSVVLKETDSEVAAETLQTKIAGGPPSMIATALISTFTPNLDEYQADPQLESEIINKRRILALGGIVLFLLIISVWFGSKARTESQLSASFTKLETEVNQQLAASATLSTTDQIQARQALRALTDNLTLSKKTFEKNDKWLAKWNQLNTLVTTSYQQLAGEAAVTELPEWFSLSVIKSGFVGNDLTIAGDNLVILDTTTNTLAKISLSTKRGEIIAGGDSSKKMEYLALEGNRAIVTTEVGVEEISLARKTTATLIQKDSTWVQLGGIAVFNGNVYLLDSGAGEIWRYPAITAGVGDKQRWLGNGVVVPNDTVGGLQVDGDLWLLQPNGIIKRFRRGAPLSFSLIGLDIPLSASTTSLQVSDDQDLLAVLDQGNQRIVGFDKQGNYKKQIKWAGLADTTDFTLSKDAKTLYILKRGSIYTANW